MIHILGLLGMYFDAVVVEVKTFLLLFRLALAILWSEYAIQQKEQETETNEKPANLPRNVGICTSLIILAPRKHYHICLARSSLSCNFLCISFISKSS